MHSTDIEAEIFAEAREADSQQSVHPEVIPAGTRQVSHITVNLIIVGAVILVLAGSLYSYLVTKSQVAGLIEEVSIEVDDTVANKLLLLEIVERVVPLTNLLVELRVVMHKQTAELELWAIDPTRDPQRDAVAFGRARDTLSRLRENLAFRGTGTLSPVQLIQLNEHALVLAQILDEASRTHNSSQRLELMDDANDALYGAEHTLVETRAALDEIRHNFVTQVQKATESEVHSKRAQVQNLQTHLEHSRWVQVLTTSLTVFVCLGMGVLFSRLLQLSAAQARAAQDARAEALRASEAKSEFLARMSHEIRTPLNGTLGMVDLLLSSGLDERQQRFATTARGSGEALLGVINDVLDFSKIESGSMVLDDEPFDLAHLLEDLGDQFAGSAQRKGLELVCAASAQCAGTYRGDALRLRQVLTNLLGNAIKFTETGEVVLWVEQVVTADGINRLSFEVRDTGVGIAGDAQQVVFESFTQEDGSTTRRFGGTGLGLAISARLVSLMGGEIELHSRVGEGSCFSFRLALERVHEIEGVAVAIPRLDDVHVLVVDDNETNLEVLAHQLAASGARCSSFSNAVDALTGLQAMLSTDLPQVAVLDMNMPGMDGVELARRMQGNEKLSSIHVMVLSSVSDSIDADVRAACNIEFHLTKPVRVEELCRCLVTMKEGRATVGTALKVAVAVPSTCRRLAGRVLVAEDHPVNQQAVVEMLKLLGLQADVVVDGREAVRAVAAVRYDLVLMDWQMPDMDGLEATRVIRAAERERGEQQPVRIIATTANAMQGDRERCLEVGMDDYLSKPFRFHSLRETLENWLSVSAGEDPPSTLVFDSASIDAGPGADDVPPQATVAQPTPVEPTPTAHDEALDPTAWKQLLELGPDGEFLRSLAQCWLDTASDDVAQLEKALGNDELEAVRVAAHRLKSSSGNVAALVLAGLCRELEHAAGSGDVGGSAALFSKVKTEHTRVVQALLRHCAKAA